MISRNELEKQIKINFIIKSDELKIDEELGRGGFGIVYKGSYKSSEVAVKFFNSNINEELIKEIANEIEFMGNLRHPNIVQIYGYCPKLNNPAIVMEFMPNGSLYDALYGRKEKLPFPKRVLIAHDIASGLARLHADNVLHRDIKSQNILLDEYNRAKLTDFGLAKVKSESKSKVSTKNYGVGTYPWMAPELSKLKNKPSKECDVYSFGLVLWELASAQSQPPFQEYWDRAELIPRALLDGDIEPEPLPKDCDKNFAAIVEGCRSLVPSERLSIEQVLERLAVLKKGLKPQAIEKQLEELDLNKEIPYQVYSENSKPLIFSNQKKPKVDNQELAIFLDLVAAGQQPKAEEMLKNNPDLALAKGTVTDLPAKRTFKDITGFQYAVWALDWQMWEMIKKYLPPEEACLQAEGFATGSWVKKHGEHAGWTIKKVIDALKTLEDYWDNWDSEKCDTHWVQQVGRAQVILPIHVLQEYYYPGRPFDPCPKFSDVSILKRLVPEYFNKMLANLGAKYALHHSLGESPMALPNVRVWMSMQAYRPHRRALVELSNTRLQQRDELVAELTPRVKFPEPKIK